MNDTTTGDDPTPPGAHRPRMPISLVEDDRVSADAVRIFAGLDICEGWDQLPGVEVSVEDLSDLVHIPQALIIYETRVLQRLGYITRDDERLYLHNVAAEVPA